jgi:hypothetical protein
MTPPDLLGRVAVTLRERIGPAVDEPFARTQAFMAAVVLEKLSGQLAASAVDAAAEEAERLALVGALEGRCASLDPALGVLRIDGSDRAWSGLVIAVHGARDELGADFEPLLGEVRRTLRGRLDRALVYSS